MNFKLAALDSLQQAKKHLQVPAKDIHQISHELFTSLFVLGSQIRFKPTAGRLYWLYFKNDEYRLSLISPQQWSESSSGRFIGICELQADLTWTLQLSDGCQHDSEFIEKIALQRKRFEKAMQDADKVDDVLPVYVANLPFYSRLLASALSCSLSQSMQKSGISGLSLAEAEKVLKLSAQ